MGDHLPPLRVFVTIAREVPSEEKQESPGHFWSNDECEREWNTP